MTPGTTTQSVIEAAKSSIRVCVFITRQRMRRRLPPRHTQRKEVDSKGRTMDDAAGDRTAPCTMQLNRDKATLDRHETFPLRYGWLPKGLETREQNPGIFSQPEQAMIALGVGRNMVNAIQCCAVDTIQRRRSRFRSPGESRRSRPIPVLRPTAALLRPVFKCSPTEVCPCSVSPACIRSHTATTQGV